MLAVSYGAFMLSYGVSFGQAVVAGLIGIVGGFLLVGLVSIAGKRGSAPTLVLSRAPFGRYGNSFPGAVSYLLLVGWETVLVALSTKAVATVFAQLGWSSGDGVKIVAFLVVAAAIVGAGILGFDAIMRIQRWLTIAMVVVTAIYIGLTLDEIHWSKATDLSSGSTAAVIGRGDPGAHRLRARLGQHRGRLLALPPAQHAAPAAWSSGRRSAAASRWWSWSATACCCAPRARR